MKLGLKDVLRLCESEAEKTFLNAAYSYIEGLIPQYRVRGYRLDFAVPDKMIAIEIDGQEYHKTKAQRRADAKRQRALELIDWTVIRFTGSEIYEDAASCVNEALQLLDKDPYQSYDKTCEIDQNYANIWYKKAIGSITWAIMTKPSRLMIRQ